MKKQLLLLGLIVLVFASSSCKKDSSHGKIMGTWKYVSSIGGFVSTPTSNSESQLKLTENNYEFIKDGKIIEEGTYKITDEKSWAGDSRIIFSVNTDEYPKQYIKVSKKKLTIFVGASIAADGVEHHYIKIKN